MAKFSERMGITPVSTAIQIDAVDEPLRNRLWNVLSIVIWNPHVYASGRVDQVLTGLLNVLWHDHFTEALDTMPSSFSMGRDTVYQHLRDYFFSCEWYEVYDFLEFLIANWNNNRGQLVNGINAALEAERSGFRVVGGLIAPISDDTERQAIREGLETDSASVRSHLDFALSHFADRTNPDFRNSVKESISAVEAICKEYTGEPNATLGACVKKIGGLHPAFAKALENLYGYTSDAGGIRHALIEGDRIPTHAEAKLMLVLASAFVNFVTEIESREQT